MSEQEKASSEPLPGLEESFFFGRNLERNMTRRKRPTTRRGRKTGLGIGRPRVVRYPPNEQRLVRLDTNLINKYVDYFGNTGPNMSMRKVFELFYERLVAAESAAYPERSMLL